MDDTYPCPQCDSDAHPFGQLGRLIWYMCRYCGWQWPIEED